MPRLGTCVDALVWVEFPLKLAPGGLGCTKNNARDVAALVLLEKRGVPEVLSDPGSA